MCATRLVELCDSIQLITQESGSQGLGNYSDLVSNIVTIIIGLVAGFIALYQVKSNIISTARIKWIEGLREALSAFNAEVINCSTTIENIHHLQMKDNAYDLANSAFYSEYVRSSTELTKLASRIFLFLNSNEESHKAVENLVTEITDFFDEETAFVNFDGNPLIGLTKQITERSKLIFKVEWKKSKKIFRI